MKQYYSYSKFIQDIKILHKKISVYNPDAIVAIARGGLTIAHFLSIKLNCRKLYTINSIGYDDNKKLDSVKIFNIPNLNNLQKVVIVDDIIDSGDTIKEILKLLKSNYPNTDFKIATIFHKKTASIQPNFYLHEATEWIDFFWEVNK